MDIEQLRAFCKTLPHTTEDVKWGNDLCFLIGGKMYCVTGLTPPFKLSFKVRDDEFDEAASSPGFIPAPYLARYKWVLLEEPQRLKNKEIEHYVRQSYELIKGKLPKKMLKELES
jgi:predicted DNA-binding protein (MmcQ/YjbR family)